ATRLGGQMAAKWRPRAAPDGNKVKALKRNEGNRVSGQVEEADGKGMMQKKGGQWQAFEQSPVEKNGLNDVYNRITREHKTWRIPGTGLTAKLDLNAIRRTGTAKSNRPAASEPIRANVYKHTPAPPRWPKHAGPNLPNPNPPPEAPTG
ncbi:AvrE-family type 3 secretion system effector, partial [Pseudomonas syringae]